MQFISIIYNSWVEKHYHHYQSTCATISPTVLAKRHRRRNHWKDVLDQATLSLSRTQRCFEAIEQDDKLDYALPTRPNMQAGLIVKHCCETIDNLLDAQKPCAYKVGYTHDASFRWHNPKYGYRWEKMKWEKLIVIYAASETISPAFIEGALIQRMKGSLNAHNVGVVQNLALYAMMMNCCIKVE